MYSTPAYFNNFNLSQLPGVSVYDYDFIESPKRNLQYAKLARADKSVLTSAEYSEKTVTITGIVCGSTKNDIEANFETLKGVVQIPEGTLRIENGGLQIEYTGTLNGITHQYMGNKLKFTLSFLCSDPIGRNRLITTLLNVTNTLETQSWPITVLGSFKAQPNIKITFNSVSGATNKTVQALNADSGQGITVTNTFANGDILDIDVQAKLVTLNTTIIDYGGVFPTFYPGSRSFQYIDDFTSRDVSIEMTYNKQFA